jgi:hypothetical protein
MRHLAENEDTMITSGCEVFQLLQDPFRRKPENVANTTAHSAKLENMAAFIPLSLPSINLPSGRLTDCPTVAQDYNVKIGSSDMVLKKEWAQTCNPTQT